MLLAHLLQGKSTWSGAGAASSCLHAAPQDRSTAHLHGQGVGAAPPTCSFSDHKSTSASPATSGNLSPGPATLPTSTTSSEGGAAAVAPSRCSSGLALSAAPLQPPAAGPQLAASAPPGRRQPASTSFLDLLPRQAPQSSSSGLLGSTLAALGSGTCCRHILCPTPQPCSQVRLCLQLRPRVDGSMGLPASDNQPGQPIASCPCEMPGCRRQHEDWQTSTHSNAGGPEQAAAPALVPGLALVTDVQLRSCGQLWLPGTWTFINHLH